jgi:hypothetical protein
MRHNTHLHREKTALLVTHPSSSNATYQHWSCAEIGDTQCSLSGVIQLYGSGIASGHNYSEPLTLKVTCNKLQVRLALSWWRDLVCGWWGCSPLRTTVQVHQVLGSVQLRPRSITSPNMELPYKLQRAQNGSFLRFCKDAAMACDISRSCLQ